MLSAIQPLLTTQTLACAFSSPRGRFSAGPPYSTGIVT
jgi:hypothetical protein